MVKGARLRTLSRRRSWVQVPSPAPHQDLFAVVYHLKKQGRKETTLVAISACDAYWNDAAIGSDHRWKDFFDGAIDNIMIYNRTLSAEEVMAHYLLPPP